MSMQHQDHLRRRRGVLDIASIKFAASPVGPNPEFSVEELAQQGVDILSIARLARLVDDQEAGIELYDAQGEWIRQEDLDLPDPKQQERMRKQEAFFTRASQIENGGLGTQHGHSSAAFAPDGP